MSTVTRPTLRRTLLALAVAAVVSCDDLGASGKATADKVTAGLGDFAKLPDLNPTPETQQVTQALGKAADEAAAGPFKAVAAATAAGVDQRAAFVSGLRLKEQEAAVRRTLVDVRRLAEQVNASQTYAAGYLKADPKAAVAALSETVAAMQGNAQQPTWNVNQVGSVPALAAAQADAARLQGELDAKTQEIAALQKQRTDLLAESDVQLNHARGLKGVEAVQAFGDAAQSRRRGEDLAIAADLTRAAADRLTTELAAARTQVEVVQRGVEQLKQQGAQLEAGWTKAQGSAAGQKKLVASVVAGDAATPLSIDASLKTLVKQLADVTAARSAALALLNEAKKHAQTARDEAAAYGTSMNALATQPGKAGAPYKALLETVNPQSYLYLDGTVQSDRAALALSQASLYLDVKAATDAVKSALDAAAVTAPAALAEVDLTALDQLLKAAGDDFTEAAATFTNVESGAGPKSLKPAAQTARLLTMFGHLNLLGLREANGDKAAKDEAAKLLADARQLKGEMAEANVPLPALPGEFGEANTAAPVPPSGGPPASQPTPVSVTPVDAKSLIGTFRHEKRAGDVMSAVVEYTLSDGGVASMELKTTIKGKPVDKYSGASPATWTLEGKILKIHLNDAAADKMVVAEVDDADTFFVTNPDEKGEYKRVK